MKLSNSKGLIDFIWDCYIKSFEIKDVIIYSTINKSLVEKMNILLTVYSNFDFFIELFENRIIYLKQKITLNISGEKLPVEDVFFHEKYGWVVSNKQGKAYLGKYSIYEDLEFEIGTRTYLSGHGIIRGNGKLVIGSYCSIATGIYINISYENQPIDYPASIGLAVESRMKNDNYLSNLKIAYPTPARENKIEIGNDVWIGRGVSFFTGVKLGDGCVIGAKSLVTKSCEPYGVYAGVPAKLIRYRFPKSIIDQLIELKWWDWDQKKILSNELFFNTNLSQYNGSIFDLLTNNSKLSSKDDYI